MKKADHDSPPTDEEWAEDAKKRINRALTILGEDATDIQILMSKVKSDGTTLRYSKGAGNWHTRVHMARMWAKIEEHGDICGDED